MTDPTDLIQHGSLIWLMATGLLLGGLHALEPGHAKTMMASFVIASRGTVPQAVLLGLSAAVSHSLLIWVLAAAALYTGNAFIGAATEPWLRLASGLAIIAIGVSMAWRHLRPFAAHDHEHDDHHHDHDHQHDDKGHGHDHLTGDAHTKAHALQVARHIGSKPVTARQIALFGLSGGLMPCPAALTLLLVCLRLKRPALGIGLVTSFSLGLAIVLVGLGITASLSLRHASRHLPELGRVANLLPYASSAVVVGAGLVLAVSGYTGLAGAG